MKIQQVAFKYSPCLNGFISDKAFNEHLTLYKGYVDKSNQIFENLHGDAKRGDANKTYSLYRGLKKGESFAMDGVILHELYFRNIGKEGQSPGPKFRELIQESYGSYERWAEDFVACAKSARGWCVAAFEQRTRRLCNILMDAHDEGLIVSAYPLLVIDMYEHAYFTDYGTDGARYAGEFMKHVDWAAVEERAVRVC